MEEANNSDNWSSIIFGSAKTSFRLRTYKFSCDPALVDQNVHVHSGHIHISFLRIIGNFLLNYGVDIYVKNNYLNNGQI